MSVGFTWNEGPVVYAGALLAWVLGLYVLTRGGFRPIPLLAAASTFSLVVYQLGQALGTLAPSPQEWIGWAQRTWWAAAIDPALWLVLALALSADEAPDRFRPALVRLEWGAGGVALLLSLLFAGLGAATDLVVRWDLASINLHPPFLPPGPLFVVYQAYVLGCLTLAALLLLFLWRASPGGSPLRTRFGWLLDSALLFLLAGVYVTAASSYFDFSGLPGQMLLSAGLVIMAWNVARYGALLAGETVQADLLAFGLATTTVVAGYAVLAWLFLPHDFHWIELVLPGLLVLVATHVLADRQNVLLDSVIFGRRATDLRARLRDLADRVVRQPDPVSALVEVREAVAALLHEQTHGREPSAASFRAPLAGEVPPAGPRAPAELRMLVEGALRHLNDLPTLSEHPLLDRLPGQEKDTSALERARHLRGQLEAAVARLQPAGARPSPGSPAGPGGWLHYIVLHEAYVEGRPNKQVMQRYQLSESTFHRARRRAIDALADDLCDRWQARPPHPGSVS